MREKFDLVVWPLFKNGLEFLALGASWNLRKYLNWEENRSWEENRNWPENHNWIKYRNWLENWNWIKYPNWPENRNWIKYRKSKWYKNHKLVRKTNLKEYQLVDSSENFNFVGNYFDSDDNVVNMRVGFVVVWHPHHTQPPNTDKVRKFYLTWNSGNLMIIFYFPFLVLAKNNTKKMWKIVFGNGNFE